MIRVLRAIAWVRWRTLLHTLQRRGRGGRLARITGIAELLVPIAYGLLLIPLCLGLSIGAFLGGRQMALTGGSIEIVIVSARVILGLVSFGVLLAPLVRSVQGLQMGVERLLLLPISRRLLHAAEVVGGMTDPWVLVVIPALVLLPAGLMLGGAWGTAGLLLLAGALFVFAMGALGSLGSNALMLVFRDRRRAEWVTLIFIAAIVLLAFLPSYIETRTSKDADPASGPQGVVRDVTQPDFEQYFGWAAGLPSELYGSSVQEATDGRHGAALARIAVLALLTALCFALSGSLHRRLLDSPERSSARRSNEPTRVKIWILPGVSAAVSAVASTQVRNALRTVRGKIAVYFVVVVVILISMIFGRQFLTGLSVGDFVDTGPLVLLLGTLMTLLSLQPILMNQFAIDGPGLSLQFLTPVSNRDLVLGKIFGCAVLAGISLLLCSFGAALVSPGGSPWSWLAMVLACVSGFVVLAPACSLLSIYLPKRSDLNRMGKAGDPHGVAAVLGIALTGVTLAPPVTLYAVGILLLESPPWALLLVGGWSLVALGLSLPLHHLAVSAMARRRESLYLVATEGAA